jgi:hypothetical protein
MKRVFADTAYFVALVRKRDQLHRQATMALHLPVFLPLCLTMPQPEARSVRFLIAQIVK